MSNIKKKNTTIFDVCNNMPDGSISLFYNMAGGKSLGKKHNNNAIIEVLVDDETFQDFVLQKINGASEIGNKAKIFVMLAIDYLEYNKVVKKLKTKQP